MLTPGGTLEYNRSTTYSVQTAPSLLKFYSFRSDTDLDAISDATAESLRFSNINVIVNSGTTTIRLSDTDKKAAGPISVCARVVNNRSSQVIFVEAWTLKVYINTVYGGLFVFYDPSSNVRTNRGEGEGRLEVAGYSSIPGNVREEVKNAVTFLSGSNYNSSILKIVFNRTFKAFNNMMAFFKITSTKNYNKFISADSENRTVTEG